MGLDTMFLNSKEGQKVQDLTHKKIIVNNREYTTVNISSNKHKAGHPETVQAPDGTLYIHRILTSSDAVYSKLKSLDIDGVPHIIDFEQKIEGTHIIEEFIDGITLEEYSKNKVPVTEDLVYDFMLQLCKILEGIHSAGIIHNDIKLSNIMIDKTGKLWLIDFDTSKILGESKKPDYDTNTIKTATPGYAMLEQLNGSSDESTDIGLLAKTFQKILGKDYQGYLKDLLEKCADNNQENRYQSAKDLEKAIPNSKLFYEKLHGDQLDIPEFLTFHYPIYKKTFELGFFKKDTLTIWSGGLSWNGREILSKDIKDIKCTGLHKTFGIGLHSLKPVTISLYSGETDIQFKTNNQELKQFLWRALAPTMMSDMLSKYIYAEKEKLIEFNDTKNHKGVRPYDLIRTNEMVIQFDTIHFYDLHKDIPFAKIYETLAYSNFKIINKDSGDNSSEFSTITPLPALSDPTSFKSLISLIVINALFTYKPRNLASLLPYSDALFTQFHRECF